MDGISAWPSPSAGAVTVTQADGFVVVSWWRTADCKGVPPYSGEYQYEWFATLEQAERCHNDYEAGEFSRATARGIFAAKGGMPIGGRVL